MSSPANFKERDLQRLVGNILRWGVVIAMSVVATGLILYLFHAGGQTVDYSEFNPVKFPGIADVIHRLSHGEPVAIIQLGAILLIATPIARVVFAMVGYALEKDRMYVIVSLIILTVIAVSIVYGAVE